MKVRQVFINLKEALNEIIKEEKTYYIIKHALRAGQEIKLHYHVKANEWILIDLNSSSAKFVVQIGKETKVIESAFEILLIHFPPKINHALKAIDDLTYYVIRDQPDKTIYI